MFMRIREAYEACSKYASLHGKKEGFATDDGYDPVLVIFMDPEKYGQESHEADERPYSPPKLVKPRFPNPPRQAGLTVAMLAKLAALCSDYSACVSVKAWRKLLMDCAIEEHAALGQAIPSFFNEVRAIPENVCEMLEDEFDLPRLLKIPKEVSKELDYDVPCPPAQAADFALLRMTSLFSYSQGSFEEAETLAESALNIYPKCRITLAILADCQFTRGDYVQACNSYKKALSLSPTDEHLLLCLAQAAEASGNIKMARKAYNGKALKNAKRFYISALAGRLRCSKPRALRFFAAMPEMLKPGKGKCSAALMDIELGRYVGQYLGIGAIAPKKRFRRKQALLAAAVLIILCFLMFETGLFSLGILAVAAFFLNKRAKAK
jgi:tetratricopeptide (TPR) repeat protein